MLTGDNSASESPSSEPEPGLVKTKALKCSRILINPPPEQELHRSEDPINKDLAAVAVAGAGLGAGAGAEDPAPAGTLPPFAGNIPVDLLMDNFEIGEACLSDFLNSDLLGIGNQDQFNNNSNTSRADLFADQNQVQGLPWAAMSSDCAHDNHQANAAGSNFHQAFASFLDYNGGDQWLWV
ncbi:uncharacterized protein J3R85_018345 [Psidium guajava]|nr:uncharacterized protein J3R85_018345 [Psidium guajava]